MDIIILAGGKVPESLRELYGVELMADVPIGPDRRPMIDYVLQAVKASELRHDRLIIVGRQVEGAYNAPAGDSLFGSLQSGLELVRHPRCLVMTADLPFLTGESLRRFVEASEFCQLAFAAVRNRACQNQFPRLKRTTLRFKEGVFTGGNVAMLKPKELVDLMPLIEQATDLRKNTRGLVQLICTKVGIGNACRLLLGYKRRNLSLGVLETLMAKRFGLRVKIVQTDDADLGADVDTLDQYAAANVMLHHAS
jgi:GTP:adenosylcobinamide-phosphate guanylyltransferase